MGRQSSVVSVPTYSASAIMVIRFRFLSRDSIPEPTPLSLPEAFLPALDFPVTIKGVKSPLNIYKHQQRYTFVYINKQKCFLWNVKQCFFLSLNQCDENTTFSNHALYLGLPCCKDDFNGCPNIPSSLIFQRSTKENLWISTQLSSTKLTQNGTLLSRNNNVITYL